MRARNGASSTSVANASVHAGTSPGGTSIPLTFSRSVSGMPPTRLATTGRPHPWASADPRPAPRRRPPRRIGPKLVDVDRVVEHARSRSRHPSPRHDPIAQIRRRKNEATRQPREEWRAQSRELLDVKKERQRNPVPARDEREG